MLKSLANFKDIHVIYFPLKILIFFIGTALRLSSILRIGFRLMSSAQIMTRDINKAITLPAQNTKIAFLILCDSNE
jgi:hypothetical protein